MEMEKGKLVAEISPHIRRTNWDYDRLRKLAKQKTDVRVTGWRPLEDMP